MKGARDLLNVVTSPFEQRSNNNTSEGSTNRDSSGKRVISNKMLREKLIKYRNIIKKQKEVVTNLQEENKALKLQLDEDENEMIPKQEYDQLNQQFLQYKEAFKKKYRKLKLENDMFRSTDEANYAEKLVFIQNELTDITYQRDILKTELGAQQDSFSNMKESLESDVETYTEKLKNLQEESTLLKDSLQDQLQSITLENEHLQEKYEEAIKTIQILEMKCKNDEGILKKQRESLQDYNTLEKDRKFLTCEVKRLKRKNTELESDVSSLEYSLHIMSTKVEHLTLELDELNPEFQIVRTPEEQEKLDKALHESGFDIPDTETVLDWYNCSGGFLYISTNYICFFRLITKTRVIFPIKSLTSVNKVTSKFLPVITLSFRTKEGDVHDFSGFMNPSEVISALELRTRKLYHTISIYHNGHLVE
eukprot:TRINITY_DN11151_c0_g1_i1.p1 TRINITY_DN11151_c0_g1~~TRINITY_DN11151_c0_g1_i1.p1  ORF type:complete len:421 (-),score=90.45 TRINITY_DN11151_c0_g1_i1:124-1386(-)